MSAYPYHISPYYKPLSVSLWAIGLVFAVSPWTFLPSQAFALGFIFAAFAALTAIACIPDFSALKKSKIFWLTAVGLMIAGAVYIFMAEPGLRIPAFYQYCIVPLSCLTAVSWWCKDSSKAITSGLWRYVLAMPIVVMLYFYALLQDVIFKGF